MRNRQFLVALFALLLSLPAVADETGWGDPGQNGANQATPVPQDETGWGFASGEEDPSWYELLWQELVGGDDGDK